MKTFSFILLNFLMHSTNSNSRTSLIKTEKKIKIADLLRFFAFYINNLILICIDLKGTPWDETFSMLSILKI